MDRTAFEALAKAYTETDYQVMLAMGEHIVLRVGETSRACDDLLREYEAETAAFVTPENPESTELADFENYQRCVACERVLADAGLKYLRGTGRSRGKSWPGENSFFVFGVSEVAASRLAHSFGQNAFIMYDRGDAARLVWCVAIPK